MSAGSRQRPPGCSATGKSDSQRTRFAAAPNTSRDGRFPAQIHEGPPFAERGGYFSVLLDGAEDFDGDGLTNEQEIEFGTSIVDFDSDLDGASDWTELNQGGDPLMPEDAGLAQDEAGYGNFVLTIGTNGGHGSWRLTVGEHSVYCGFGATESRTVRIPRGSVSDIRVDYCGTEPAWFQVHCRHDFRYIALVYEADPTNPCIEEILDDQEMLLGAHNPLPCYDGHACNPAEGKVARLIIPGVRMVPDGTTHLSIAPAEVMLIPGDNESLHVEYTDAEAPYVVLRSSDPSTFKFVLGEGPSAEFLNEVPVTMFAQGLTEHPKLRGLAPGTAVIQPFVDGVLDECGVLPVKVGGMIRLDIGQPPTFTPGSGSGPVAGSHPFQVPGDFEVGGGPLGSGGDFERQPFDPNLVDDLGSDTQPGYLRVELLDAVGRAKPGRPVALLSLDGKLSIPGELLEKTDREGRVEFTAIAIPPGVGGEQSVEFEKVITLIGRAADDERAGFLTDLQIRALEPAQSFALGGEHEFHGHKVRFQRDLVTDIGVGDVNYFPLQSFDLPMINAVHYSVLRNRIAFAVYDDPIQLNGQSITIVDAQGNPTSVTINVSQLLMDPENLPTFLSVPMARVLEVFEERIYSDSRYAFSRTVFEVRPVEEPLGPPPPEGWQDLTYAALVLEFGLGFVPGYDIVDVFKECLWKPIINDEPTNYIVAGIALIALAADAGYLAGPAGLVTNAIAGSIKVIVKHIPEPAVKALLRMGDTAMHSADILFEYIDKCPKPANFVPTSVSSVTDWAVSSASLLISQWNKILNSPIGISPANLATSVKLINARCARTLADEAAEGVAAFAKHNANADETLGLLFSRMGSSAAGPEYAARSAESIATSYRKSYLALADGSGGARMAERVRDSVEAGLHSLHPNYRNVVAPHVGPGQAFETMEEFEALRFMRADDLRADQVTAIRAIRDAIPAPVAGTPMQKVIKGSRIDSMIGADTIPLGFVAKQSDAGTGVFSNSDEMIDGLRLDYDGGFGGESSVGVIEFPMPAGASTEIPYGVGFGGTAIDPYPFAGNGFVASPNGRLTVEYTSSALPPEGAQLFRLDQSGVKMPVATVVSGRWVAVSP